MEKREHRDSTSTPIYFLDIYHNRKKGAQRHYQNTNIFSRYLQDFSVKYNWQQWKKGSTETQPAHQYISQLFTGLFSQIQLATMEKREHRDSTSTPIYFLDIYRTFQSNTTCNNRKKGSTETLPAHQYISQIFTGLFSHNQLATMEKREQRDTVRYLEDFSLKYNLQHWKKGSKETQLDI
jgi:hypothetical protein